MASHTVASLATDIVLSKAIAIEFEALGFFAVAEDAFFISICVCN